MSNPTQKSKPTIVPELQNPQVRSNYISSQPQSSEEDSSDVEHDTECRLVFPSHRSKGNSSRDLIAQLVSSQNTIMRSHSKLCKLKCEMNRIETQLHYNRLDLNNANIRAEKAEKDLKEKTNLLFWSRVKNYAMVALISSYFVYESMIWFDKQI